MPTLRELYLRGRKPISDLTTAEARQMEQEPALVDGEYTERQGAFRVAHMMREARPQKTIIVLNIFGSKRWFVRGMTEAEARQILKDSKQCKPTKRRQRQ